MRRVVAAAVCALALVPAASGATPTGPLYDSRGRLIETPFVPPAQAARLDAKRALAIFERNGKVAAWLRHYPRRSWVTDATFDSGRSAWTLKIWSGSAGEVATGTVDDGTGAVTEAWTGPQVAWKMARGSRGAFGGRLINTTWLWLVLCAAFLVGLADLRRPLRLRNLDLLVLLSPSVSLWFFNRGDIFTSVPLVYPTLVYLLGRMLWIGARGRASPSRPVWPVWLIAAAAIFLAGFRVGLNVEDSNVIDVGYAGVIGAHRIAHGQAPYGHMPIEGKLKACGPASADGEVRDRIQTNGRCESANDRGDTYGPIAYLAYLPGYALLGWSGKWDDLPAAHLTSILFDLLCLAGLALVGRRFGGNRLAATLAFAWAAYPFTQYVSSSNTNDAIAPAFLIWGFWLATVPWARGALTAFAGWTKLAALVVAPLWLAYPEARWPRARAGFLAGFAAATALGFWVLLLEPSPLHAVRVAWERTVVWQLGRNSPFSIWDWRQYHAGLPDLHVLQRVLQALLVAGALAAVFLPRRKSPLQLAALTAALLIGFELTLTHWFYLYIPWFFPFAAFALLATAPVAVAAEVKVPRDRPLRELAPTG